MNALARSTRQHISLAQATARRPLAQTWTGPLRPLGLVLDSNVSWSYGPVQRPPLTMGRGYALFPGGVFPGMNVNDQQINKKGTETIRE